MRAVLLAEHAAWSGSPRHLLLALEWCRQQLGSPLRGSGAGTSLAGSAGGGLGSAGGEPRQASEAGAARESSSLGRGGKDAESLLMAARIIARADELLSQPRARF